MSAKLCEVRGCINFGRYCRRIHSPSEIKAQPEPKPVKGLKRASKPIAKLSKKRQAIQRKEYRPLVNKMLGNPALGEYTECKVKSPDCTGLAQGLHHLKGRTPKTITDKRFLIPSCNQCQTYLEVHDKWAREHGFKLSKHSKD